MSRIEERNKNSGIRIKFGDHDNFIQDLMIRIDKYFDEVIIPIRNLVKKNRDIIERKENHDSRSN